jgi:peptidylprolyl isomerase
MATSFSCAEALQARCRAGRARKCRAQNGVTDPKPCHGTARLNFDAKFVNGDNALPMISFLFATLLAAATPAKPVPPPDLTTPPADALNAGNGLISKQLVPGKSSEMPSDDDFVKVRYTLWSAPDGKLIDFIAPPQWVVAGLGVMNLGLKQSIEMMHPGEVRRSWIDERAGARGRVPPGGRLVADIELLEIIHPPSKPIDVARPPENATVTKSGLAYRVLRKGTGTRHPKASDTVVVHYSGWQTTGYMVDSSVLRGEPTEFPLNAVIPGWREGLQLMVEGEKARFWVPQGLAYKGEAGKPVGMLVFDIELIKIK